MKKTELLNTQMCVEESNNKESYSENISVIEQIENTPFRAVKTPDGWMVTMGEDIVSGKKFENIEQVEEYVDKKDWELILVAGGVYNRMLNELNKQRDEQ